MRRAGAMGWLAAIGAALALSVASRAPFVQTGQAATTPQPWEVPPYAANRPNPVAGDEAALKAGRKIFLRTCRTCHGKRGEGDGPSAGDLDVPPTDLTGEAVQRQSDGALFWKISTGRSPMPAYGKESAEPDNARTDEEIWQIVRYLRTLKDAAKEGGGNGDD